MVGCKSGYKGTARRRSTQAAAPRTSHWATCLELNSAPPIRRVTPESKAYRGTKYTGELPPDWSQDLPPPRLPKRPPLSKTSRGPNRPP